MLRRYTGGSIQNINLGEKTNYAKISAVKKKDKLRNIIMQLSVPVGTAARSTGRGYWHYYILWSLFFASIDEVLI
jgi:hypothetical protein